MQRLLFWGSLVGLLLVLNGLIWQKEQTLASGQLLLLELAPVDPRSLIQGDYMVLRYQLSDEAQALLPDVEVADGFLVLRLDARGVGKLERIHGQQPVKDGEQLLRYRVRSSKIRLGAESFFFQEGQAGTFQDARFGELRVTRGGESVLVGLRNKNLEPLIAHEAAPVSGLSSTPMPEGF